MERVICGVFKIQIYRPYLVQACVVKWHRGSVCILEKLNVELRGDVVTLETDVVCMVGVYDIVWGP